jgi:hypothetical protein
MCLLQLLSHLVTMYFRSKGTKHTEKQRSRAHSAWYLIFYHRCTQADFNIFSIYDFKYLSSLRFNLNAYPFCTPCAGPRITRASALAVNLLELTVIKLIIHQKSPRLVVGSPSQVFEF